MHLLTYVKILSKKKNKSSVRRETTKIGIDFYDSLPLRLCDQRVILPVVGGGAKFPLVSP